MARSSIGVLTLLLLGLFLCRDSQPACATVTASVALWGGQFDGQAEVPDSLTNVVAISARGDFNLALRSDGTVVAFGLRFSPADLVPPDLSGVVAIASGH